MIHIEAMTARSAPLMLAALTFDFGAGAHALLGAREDGVALLLAVVAGRVALRSGRLEVLNAAPDAVRRDIAYVPLDVSLPEALTVEETIDAASAIRGDRAGFAMQRLGTLGIAPLAKRRVRSLTLGEARAVAMAEALTSGARVLLLEEPFVALDPRAAPLLAEKVRERARDGACVVVSTSSVRDAAELADQHLVFDRGALVRAMASTDPRAMTGASGARLRVRASDVRALLPLLGRDPSVREIETDHGSLVLSGDDMLALATAVSRAVLAAGVELELLRPDAPMVDEMKRPMLPGAP